VRTRPGRISIMISPGCGIGACLSMPYLWRKSAGLRMLRNSGSALEDDDFPVSPDNREFQRETRSLRTASRTKQSFSAVMSCRRPASPRVEAADVGRLCEPGARGEDGGGARGHSEAKGFGGVEAAREGVHHPRQEAVSGSDRAEGFDRH